MIRNTTPKLSTKQSPNLLSDFLVYSSSFTLHAYSSSDNMEMIHEPKSVPFALILTYIYSRMYLNNEQKTLTK